MVTKPPLNKNFNNGAAIAAVKKNIATLLDLFSSAMTSNGLLPPCPATVVNQRHHNQLAAAPAINTQPQ